MTRLGTALLAHLLAAPAAAASFGLIPSHFPRDPISFDTYPEQIAIGQVLETLVTSDQFGNVASSVADKWRVSDHGRKITFRIRPNLVFSDGTPVTSADVVASLSRHWKDSKAHSFTLLENISRIDAAGPKTVVIGLKHPQVAIFKILSRNHFGIMPSAWRFSKDAAEPFVGSGPYRLVQKGAGWSFVKNERYRDAPAVTIPEWDIVFLPPAISDIDKIPLLPDYAPSLRGPLVNLLKRNPRFDPADYQIQPRLGFSQVLAWWNPHSASYRSELARHVKMGALRMLFVRRRSALKLPAAFGLIPYGVAAHLVSAVPFDDLTRDEVAAASKRSPGVGIVRVGVPARLRKDIFEPKDVETIERLLGVKFEIVEGAGFDSTRSDADIVIDLWAGGFNDPEGFVPIISDMTTLPLKEYLSTLWPLYLAASTELNWTKRSELFRKFDHALVSQERLLPGWRTESFSLLKNEFVEAQTGYRYTPRLQDVRRR